jgi:hemerythrin-like domain-containing protein
MKATEQLRNEHNGILIMLEVFEKIINQTKNGDEFDKGDISDIIDFLKVFADKCHHGKEEGILFPAMIASGLSGESGPIAVMLMEHGMGREYIKGMVSGLEKFDLSKEEGIKILLENGEKYIQLLRSHIFKENNILFPIADQRISELEQNKLFLDYEEMETKVIGAGVHDKFHSLIHILRDKYLNIK